MNLKRLLTIFRKDARASILDGRVLVAILVPIGLALFYNATIDDGPQTPSATVAYTETAPALPDALRAATGDNVDLSFEAASPEKVRSMVADEDADVSLVAPEGFDSAVQSGGTPQLTVLLPESESLGASVVVSSLDPALRGLAGQSPPAGVETETVGAEQSGSESVLPQLGLSTYFVLAAVVLLVVMICMLAVPVILAEESEKKTLDALAMVASYGEVVAAKALVGLLYVAVSVALLLGITGLFPEEVFLFVAAVTLLSVTLIGFGLLMGGLFQNANQLNTWSGFLLIPVAVPAFLVGFPMPDLVDRILTFIPVSQAMRLAINSMNGQTLFPNPVLSFVVIVAWGVAAYALLSWSLRRRQAVQ